MTEVECGRCCGKGRQEWEEDDRDVSDVCYRCAGTGRISEESAHDLLVQRVAEVLAHNYIEDYRRACNEDPNGDGWALHAAENMMTERDYTVAAKADKAAMFSAELSKLSHTAQRALIETVLPKPVAAKPPAAKPPAPTAPVNDDDIPF